MPQKAALCPNQEGGEREREEGFRKGGRARGERKETEMICRDKK